MKNIGEEIDRIVKKKGLLKKNIAEKLGMTPVNFSKIMKKDNIDCKLLESICKAIDVSPALFFIDVEENETPENEVNKPKEHFHNFQSENELLKMIIAEKERTIKMLMDIKGIGTISGQNR